MSVQVIGGEGPGLRRDRERRPWPERAYDNELTVCLEKPGRVLVDRLAREELAASGRRDIRDDFAVDDPFGC